MTRRIHSGQLASKVDYAGQISSDENTVLSTGSTIDTSLRSVRSKTARVVDPKRDLHLGLANAGEGGKRRAER
jgi:hypothetical protein